MKGSQKCQCQWIANYKSHIVIKSCIIQSKIFICGNSYKKNHNSKNIISIENNFFIKNFIKNQKYKTILRTYSQINFISHEIFQSGE